MRVPGNPAEVMGVFLLIPKFTLRCLEGLEIFLGIIYYIANFLKGGYHGGFSVCPDSGGGGQDEKCF